MRTFASTLRASLAVTPLCLVAGCGQPSVTTVSATEVSSSTSSTADGSTTSPTTSLPTTSTSGSTGTQESTGAQAGSTGEPPTSGSSSEGSTGSASSTTTGESTGSSTSGTSEDTTEGSASTGGEECGAPGLLVVCDKGDDVDPFHALGVGCPGAVDNTIPIADKVFNSQPIAWRAAKGFGTAKDPNDPAKLLFHPREGEKFLVISTGRVANLQADGTLVESMSQYDNDNNFNPDAPNALPAPMSPLVGSNGGQGGTPFMGCDGVHDCSDSISPNWTLGNGDPNDLLFSSFSVTVPPGVHGFLFDVAFFSSEYPQFVGQKFNDMLIGWSTSEAYTGNVTFLDGQPLTVTSLAGSIMDSGYTGAAAELKGTGFEGYGGTTWFTVQAQVTPGETFTFAYAIMDMGDSSKATVALLDHWRWDCKGCVPVEVDPLCGQQGHPKCCGLCVDPVDDPQCGTDGHPACCSGL